MSDSEARLTAVLGPTNTGKTHLAMERLIGHRSGMIGFPLRLLARENYDRLVKVKGPAQVALVTGEEKIIPPGARYFVCTVESMPVDRPRRVRRDRRDPARRRFRARPHLHRPAAACARPRRDHGHGLRHPSAAGSARWCRRPSSSSARASPRSPTPGRRRSRACRARSAVVAFSAAEVYAIADLIRRQRGGTAIVMGALSPRTRNAQVEMYQAGEVDYLVATDAIGMGLNMDVDHVCFAALRKFDGRVAAAADQGGDQPDRRPRRPAHERRHLRHHRRGRADGSGDRRCGGESSRRSADAPDVAHADLDFRSIDHLLRSLETRAAASGPDPPAGGGGSSVAAADGARSGDRRRWRIGRDRVAAAVGGLPGAGLPQADDRCACAPAGAALPAT